MLVTVRYEKRATVRRKKLYVVRIRETEGKSGDMGAWLYTMSAGEYTAQVGNRPLSTVFYSVRDNF